MPYVIHKLLERFANILEITAVATGLLYIFQAARLKRNCWIYGGISSLIFVYIFFWLRLYVDGALNGYYVLMAFVGWFRWTQTEQARRVSHMNRRHLLLCILLTSGLAAFLAFVTGTYTDADYPVLDALVGAFSITATWLTTKKKIENWGFWIVANGVAIVLFFIKELYFTTGLTIVYFTLSVTGWINWQKKLRHA